MIKYLVMAYRYGTNEYIFPVSIHSTEEDAEIRAQYHRAFRGGKYDHKVFKLEEDVLYDAEEASWKWVSGEHEKPTTNTSEKTTTNRVERQPKNDNTQT